MVKKILFVFTMALITVIVSFITMFNESSRGMSDFINQTIAQDEYENFLAYNDLYISTPLVSLETNDYIVKAHNAFDQEEQNITLIVVDKTMSEGDASQVVITCDEVFTYDDVFFPYENGNVAVLTIYQSGEGDFALNDTCQDGVIDRLQITTNDGQEIIDAIDTVMFINDGDFTDSGVTGYDQDDLLEIQYPRGLFVPLILPFSIILVGTLGLVYLYKKVFKK